MDKFLSGNEFRKGNYSGRCAFLQQLSGSFTANIHCLTTSTYLWQQSEYVMSGAAHYIFWVIAADKLLNKL
jgi:hypothetical protein